MLFLFAFSAQVIAGVSADNTLPLLIKVSVDTPALHIGEKVRYTIEVKAEKEIEVEFPSFAENLAEFAVRDFGSSESGLWGDRTRTRWYLLDIYETGKFTIPAVIIKYRKAGEEKWQEALTEEVPVEVLSMLEKEGAPAEIHDIRPPVDMYDLKYLYIIISLVVAALIIAAVVMFLKKRRKAKEAYVPLVPAHETAFLALKELKRKGYLRTGKTKEYYFELSDIVRHYLENRFHLKAPEMTTEEFLMGLKDTKALKSDHKSLLREFLSHCDMVKFAKHSPDEKEAELSYNSASMLVEQTKEISAEGGGR